MAIDLVSWTFAGDEYDQDQPLYFDASDETQSLSANAVRRMVRQIISGLQYYGLKKGECACVFSFNNIYYTPTYLGIIGSGACFTGSNPGWTARELAYHLRLTDAKFVLTESRTLDIASAAAEECSIPQHNVFVLNFNGEEVPSKNGSWKELLTQGEKDWVTIEDPRTPAAYVSTSGTTGFPKAAILSHEYWTSCVTNHEYILAKGYEVKYLITVPPFHIFAIPLQHMLALRKGIKTYIMRRFEIDGFLNAMEKFQITHTTAVPPLLMSLSKCPESRMQSLRHIYVGGSALTYGMQQELYSKLDPRARIIQAYGMTESGWSTIWQKEERDTTGSAGSPMPGYSVRAIDTEGKLVTEDGTPGEIQIYSAKSLMNGYRSNQNLTHETFTPDGWIRTGDIGYKKDGNWYIIDRTKDMIKVRGWQVSPAEIETTLLEHHEILDVGVIGIPAADGFGETPFAYVVRVQGSNISEDDVKGFLKGRLARYKNIEGVEFVDSLPRNPTGKMIRRLLREARESKLSGKEITVSYAPKQLDSQSKTASSVSNTTEDSITETEEAKSFAQKTDSKIQETGLTTTVTSSKEKKRNYCSLTTPFLYLRKLLGNP